MGQPESRSQKQRPLRIESGVGFYDSINRSFAVKRLGPAFEGLFLYFGLNEQVEDSPEGKGVSTKARYPDKNGCTYIIPMTTTFFFWASGVRPSLIPELDIR